MTSVSRRLLFTGLLAFFLSTLALAWGQEQEETRLEVEAQSPADFLSCVLAKVDFNETPLTEIIAEIRKQTARKLGYNANVIVDPSLSQLKFTIQAERISVQGLLDVINALSGEKLYIDEHNDWLSISVKSDESFDLLVCNLSGNSKFGRADVGLGAASGAGGFPDSQDSHSLASVADAVNHGLKFHGIPEQRVAISIHEPTKLLFAKGSESDLAIVRRIIYELTGIRPN